MRWTILASSLVAALATPAAAEPDARPWMGIAFSGGGQPGEPLTVTTVFPGTGAAAAGLAVGDTIVAIDGVALMSPYQLSQQIRGHEVGDRAQVDVARNGRVFRLSARLGSMPTGGELLELRLVGSPLPPLGLVDRHDGAPVGLDGRPALLVVFDARCEPCGGAASALVEAAADGGSHVAVRTVILGSAEEVAAYLNRVPVTGVVVRWPPGYDDDRGAALLAGLNLNGDGATEGAILVVDHAGVVQFAASTADLERVQGGALAAAARAQQRWRRLR